MLRVCCSNYAIHTMHPESIDSATLFANMLQPYCKVDSLPYTGETLKIYEYGAKVR